MLNNIKLHIRKKKSYASVSLSWKELVLKFKFFLPRSHGYPVKNLQPFFFLLQVYNNFRHQLQSRHLKICKRNNNWQIISLPFASRVINYKPQTYFMNMCCIHITLEYIYLYNNNKLVIKKINIVWINNFLLLNTFHVFFALNF